MAQKIISSLEDVHKFLTELKFIIKNPAFDVNRDLDILPKKKDESPIDPFTTANTILALDYDRLDICNQLINLETKDYLETFIDDKDNTLPPFYAFAKYIDNKDVYIKLKIRDRVNCKIFCVSFHFARYPFPEHLPYRE